MIIAEPHDLDRNFPKTSLQAWEATRKHFQATEQMSNHSDPKGYFNLLRSAILPGSQEIATLSGIHWVEYYQHALETIGRQQRMQGAKQTGVFFTPMPVAQYLTNQSLGQHLAQFERDIQEAMAAGLIDHAIQLLHRGSQLKIIDPACGTGVFLLNALKLLTAFYLRVQRQFPQIITLCPFRFPLQHQLFGIDVDPLSVLITELSLWQWIFQQESIQPGFNPAFKLAHLWVGDALGPHPFGEEAAWDFILANPPYVSEVRQQSDRFKSLLKENSGYYQAKMDLCDGFIAWAIDHLTPLGQLVYVLPEYWTQRTSTALLRQRLWREGRTLELWLFQDQKLFKHAPGHHSSFLLWQKQFEPTNVDGPLTLETQTIRLGKGDGQADLEPRLLQTAHFSLDTQSGKFYYGDPLEMALLQQLSALPSLFAKSEIQQGIVIPQGRLKKNDRLRLPEAVQAQLRLAQDSIEKMPGVFLLSVVEVEAMNLNAEERELLKPYYQPLGFRPFQGLLSTTPDYFLIYANPENREKIQQSPKTYARIKAHLDLFSAVNTSDFAPYGLHRARQAKWFDSENRILSPRQVMTPAFAVVNAQAYVNEGFYILRPEADDPHYCCALFNSTLGWFWLYHQKRKGHRLQIDKDVLSRFPRPLFCTETLRAQLGNFAAALARSADSKQLFQLNQTVYAAYALSEEQIQCIEQKRTMILGSNE